MRRPAQENPKTVLVVDDEPKNVLIAESLIAPLGLTVVSALSGEDALAIIHSYPPDLILLDALLPGIDGFTLCKMLKSEERTRLIPIIIVSALNDMADKVRALDCDADDFLSKPVNRHELTARLRSCLRIKTLNDLLEHSESVLFAFARAVEAKDPYTIGHSERVSRFSRELGAALGLGRESLQDLTKGGLLHDIGKIGVPDSVLAKRGPLTPEEVALVQKHPVIGEHICSALKSFGGLLRLIRSHHERLDGSGYPDALKGDQIAVEVRLVSVADQFDALTSDRPYRTKLAPKRVEEIFRQDVDAGKLDREIVNLAIPLFPAWASAAMRGT